MYLKNSKAFYSKSISYMWSVPFLHHKPHQMEFSQNEFQTSFCPFICLTWQPRPKHTIGWGCCYARLVGTFKQTDQYFDKQYLSIESTYTWFT